MDKDQGLSKNLQKALEKYKLTPLTNGGISISL
jgi:hypothetical protein